MPVNFPGKDPAGNPIQVPHFTVDEIAPMLHVSRAVIREKFRREQWPHMEVGRRFYASHDHLVEIVRLLTIDINGGPVDPPDDGDDLR